MEEDLNATITLRPDIILGNITTVAEKVLESLFHDAEYTLESENPLNDKRMFFSMRSSTIKMLVNPIKATRELKKPLVLKFTFSMDTGIMKMMCLPGNDKKK